MADQTKHMNLDKFLSTKMRIAGNVAGTVMQLLERGAGRHDELPDPDRVARYSVAVADQIVRECLREVPGE